MPSNGKEFLLEKFREDGYRIAKVDDLIRWLQAERESGHTWVALDGTLILGDGAIVWSNEPQI